MYFSRCCILSYTWKLLWVKTFANSLYCRLVQKFFPQSIVWGSADPYNIKLVWYGLSTRNGYFLPKPLKLWPQYSAVHGLFLQYTVYFCSTLTIFAVHSLFLQYTHYFCSTLAISVYIISHVLTSNCSDVLCMCEYYDSMENFKVLFRPLSLNASYDFVIIAFLILISPFFFLTSPFVDTVLTWSEPSSGF